MCTIFSCTYWCVTDVYFSVHTCVWLMCTGVFLCILVWDCCLLFFPSVHTGVWLMCIVLFFLYILVCDWCVVFSPLYIDVRLMCTVFFPCTYWCATDVYLCLCYSASGHNWRQHQAEGRDAPSCVEGRTAEHWWKLAKFKVQDKLTVILWFGVVNVHWVHVLRGCSA